MTIDNGNHLLLSGNHAALAYLRDIGAADRLVGPPHAEFPSSICASGERWTLRINDGRLPWWIFDAERRVPGTARARLSAARAAAAARRADKPVGEVHRLRRRALRAAGRSRCCSPRSTSTAARLGAALAGAVVRETLAAGGSACRPLIARDGLGASASIEPALSLLQAARREVRLGASAARAAIRRRQVDGARFRRRHIALGADDAVILAVPPVRATALVPGLDGADRIPRHRQRAFPHRAAGRLPPITRRRQRHGRMAVRFPRPAVGDHQRGRPPARRRRARNWPRRSGARSRPRPACRRTCRHGRSCASAAPPSRRRRSRMPGGPAPRRAGAICFWPAIGPRPACRRPSKARSAPATAPPISSAMP